MHSAASAAQQVHQRITGKAQDAQLDRLAGPPFLHNVALCSMESCGSLRLFRDGAEQG